MNDNEINATLLFPLYNNYLNYFLMNDLFLKYS
jgi:hypothetical protein